MANNGNRINMINKLLLLLAAAVLAACTNFNTLLKQAGWQADTDSAEGFSSEGRLAVREGEKGSYANFEWQDFGTVQNISVNTPLGNTVGVLCRDSEGVIAEDSSARQYRADSIEALSQNLLGFTLPMSHLNQWARGRWALGEAHEILADGRLRQSGWLIGRQLMADGVSPKILVLENERLNIRLVFDQFQPLDLRTMKIGRCALRGV